MTTCIALFRAVNVGGQKPVPMAALRDIASGLGLGEPRTLLQSGNLVFRTTSRKPAAVEQALEDALAEHLGVTTLAFVRSADEWRALVEANPFGREAAADPAHLLVHALKKPATAAAGMALRAAIVGRERSHVDGRHIYLVYPDGIGRSKLTTAVIDRHLGSPGTARNWNTVTKLLAMTSE